MLVFCMIQKNLPTHKLKMTFSKQTEILINADLKFVAILTTFVIITELSQTLTNEHLNSKILFT